jgi:hypothetical protein
VKRLLHSRPVDQALRGAALVVTDRRWAAPLGAAALGFGIFAGVAIGPGASGGLATGAQQIVRLPGSGDDEGRSGGGGHGVAATGSALPRGGGEASGFAAGAEGEAFASAASFAPAPVEPLPAPAPAAAPQPAPAGGEAKEEEPEGQTFEGAVAYANPAAGSYALAIERGELVSIHAAKLPAPGTKLSVPVEPLANGTFAESGEREQEKRRAGAATFRGVVTFAGPDPEAPTYTVSGRGVSLLVHVAADPAPELPQVGTYVTVTAAIDDGLLQQKLEVESGPPSTYLDLAGIAGKLQPDGTLAFSADGARESDADLALTVPKNIDAAKLKTGDSYVATVEVGEDGSLTLKGIASDEHAKGADNSSSAQGDLKR